MGVIHRQLLPKIVRVLIRVKRRHSHPSCYSLDFRQ